jgi:hypothetical protein
MHGGKFSPLFRSPWRTKLRGHLGGINMGDKGKKDKGKREMRKKAKLTLKEKRRQKREKNK